MSEGGELARSTFASHKDAIEDIFGIYIDCDRQNGYEYYIGNDYVLREDSVQNWMLSTLSVSNVISESMSLQDRILLQEVPYVGEYLKMVIDAMKKSVWIAVDYRKYGSDKPDPLSPKNWSQTKKLELVPFKLKFREPLYLQDSRKISFVFLLGCPDGLDKVSLVFRSFQIISK